MKKYLAIACTCAFVHCGETQTAASGSQAIGFAAKKASSITLSPFVVASRSAAANPVEIVPEVSVSCMRTQSHLLDVPSAYYNTNLFYPIAAESIDAGGWLEFHSPLSVKSDNSRIVDDSYSLVSAKGKDNGCYVSLSFLVYDMRVDKKDMITTRSSIHLLAGASKAQKQKLDDLFSQRRPIANIDAVWSFVDQNQEPNSAFAVTTADIAAKVREFEVTDINYKCVDCDEKKIIHSWQAVADFKTTNGDGSVQIASKDGIYVTGTKLSPVLATEKK